MCGIVGAVAGRNVVPILLDGLKRLEYRGYDSAGVAVVAKKNELRLMRSKGKVEVLAAEIASSDIEGLVGIAHTRWATHGKPCEKNAHPQQVGNRIAVVHNGIIENHEDLYVPFLQKGYQRQSETDTEVIAACIDQQVTAGLSLFEAVKKTVKSLMGAYAIAVVDAQTPDTIVVARQGSPLVIGIGIDEHFLASDPLALQKVTQEFIYLEDGDVAEIKRSEIIIYDMVGNLVTRAVQERKLAIDTVELGEYRHFMQKEIFEQPRAVRETLLGRIHQGKVLEQAFGRKAGEYFAKVENVQIVACGTSYYAGVTAKYWIEELAGLPCSVEIASEFRYRKRTVPANTLLVTLSQSGETADTLAALKSTQTETATYVARLAICNVPESSLVRESEMTFLTHAGPEIGVASTKAFITQLVSMLLLSFVLQKKVEERNQEKKTKISVNSEEHAAKLSSEQTEYLNILQQAPDFIEEVLKLDERIVELAKQFEGKQHALFLGRGACFPIALEGALKLKEISYIHAEAYPAGELKHGPLALVDSNMLVVVLAPQDEMLDKIKANIAEVHARGGRIIIVTSADMRIDLPGIEYLTVPEAPKLLNPLLMTIPMQLLAYHVAVARGTDVDHPRNLAKSVTVE